jgi:hypothetical protein
MPQEPDNGLRIEIVLVFCWFHGFWFNQEGSFETLFASIVACHAQELAQMFHFAFGVGVVQAHVPFTSTPENVV